MSVDDELAVVSFGDTSAVEYPTGGSPALQTILGPANPARLSAIQTAATLPPDLPIYSCALGQPPTNYCSANSPTTRTAATTTCPQSTTCSKSINYIRGQVTGEGIIVDESGTASESRKSAVVDGCAEVVAFSVAWQDSKLHYVPHEPVTTPRSACACVTHMVGSCRTTPRTCTASRAMAT
jgi:hypothetical protein